MSKSISPRDSAPDHSSVVLILIDVINDLDFPEGKKLLKQALPAARRIASLTKHAHRARVPVIYVNDNFGRWRSDFKSLVDHCRREGSLGAPIANLLLPAKDDYFVLKPKHSGFFSSSLDILLKQLGAETLILTGFAADICVLFTANDAYMRDYKLHVPRDCVASETIEGRDYALQQMKRFLKAGIGRSSPHLFTSPAQHHRRART